MNRITKPTTILLSTLILLMFLIGAAAMPNPTTVSGEELGQDSFSDDTIPPNPYARPDINSNCPVHSGISDFDPYSDGCDDSTFIVDVGPDLDTACVYSSYGTIDIELPVDRFIGTSDQIDQMLAAGLVEPYAYLEMPAFDVDYTSSQPYPPERDAISFNGNNLGYLTGQNNVWKLNVFRIPLKDIKFPENDPGIGNNLTPTTNTIQIEIDTQNSDTKWCTAIDWVSLKIEVARPILFVHGIRSNRDTWLGPWVDKMNTTGLVHDRISLEGSFELDSIQNNADKISVRVDDLKNRWGVDKVNVVAHSKGGLDTRHYAERSDNIDHLIQIGTPNGGSPLADAVQKAALKIRVAGIPIVSIGGVFLAPAGVQLTTYYMDGYNLFHGRNQNTTYTSLAGDYRYNDGFSFKDEAIKAFYDGPSDLIVPVWSVHELDYASHLTYLSIGDIEDAQHVKQTKSGQILNRLFENAVASDYRAPTATYTDPSYDTATQATILDLGLVEEFLIAVDQTLPGQINLYYAGGSVEFTLVSPTGQTITPASAANSSSVDYFQLPAEDGFAMYAFENLSTGIWTAKVKATSLDPGETGVFVSTWATLQGTPAIKMTATTDRENYAVGEDIIVIANLTENSGPLLNQSVKAIIGNPDQSAVEFVLSDNGVAPDTTANDGKYTGQVTAVSSPGYYPIAVTGSGTPPKTFSREELLTVTVASSTTTLAGGITHFAQDLNNNTYFDNLTFNVPLNVDQPGQYRIYGELADPSGTLIAQSSAAATLVTGNQQMQLAFEGTTIFNHRVDGPYSLKTLRIAEENDLHILPLGTFANVYQTSAYSYRQFEHPEIIILETGQDFGVDLDNNGRFNLLTVQLDVDLEQSGNYEWSARLQDKFGKEIGFATGSAFLSSGLRDVKFEFDSQLIGANRVDGPYEVNGVLVLGSGQAALDFQAYETQPYDVNKFDVVFKKFLPSIIKVGQSSGGSINVLSGQVTENGIPVAEETLQLRYFNGSTWQTYSSTKTDSKGQYGFSSVPTLAGNQAMYVLWLKQGNSLDRLSSFACFGINASNFTDPARHNCDINVGGIELLNPGNNGTVSLPYTFRWQNRSQTNENYIFRLANVSNLNPNWQSSELGDVGQFTLTSLPTGFSTGQSYGWWLNVYTSDGVGASNNYFLVNFAASDEEH